MNNKKLSIAVKNVTMTFNLGTEKVDSLKEYTIKLLKRELMFHKFDALSDISFSVYKGEVFGIIGYNGSGKSTLLKIIAGVMKPTKGSVHTHGSIAPLIELGAGFNPQLTGHENIFLNGYILGLSKEFLEAQYDEIVEFSELHKFIHVPMKNYSSGMKTRLGFSIATLVKPEILIVDEVLSVGDYKFKEKSMKRMEELIKDKTTVLFVSHSIEEVRRICSRCLWIDHGEMKMIGDVDEVCDAFLTHEI